MQGSPRPTRRRSHALLGNASLIVLAGALALQFAPAATARPIALLPFAPSPSESPQCAQINTNASLTSAYTTLYDQLATDFQNWTPAPNVTRPVNQSGYPNATDGSARLIAEWAEICDSPAYNQLYAAWGPSNITGGLQLNQTTGDYQFVYGFIWHASCNDSWDASASDCQYTATWYVDLVTGAIDGPLYEKRSGDCNCGPPPAPPVGFGPATNASRSGWIQYEYPVAYVEDNVTYGQLGFEVKTFGCAAASNVAGIAFLDPEGMPVAVESSGGSWSVGSTRAVEVGNLLVVEASAPLVGDELVSEFNDSGLEWQTASVIAGSGEWDGCQFTPGQFTGSSEPLLGSAGPTPPGQWVVQVADAGIAAAALLGTVGLLRSGRRNAP